MELEDIKTALYEAEARMRSVDVNDRPDVIVRKRSDARCKLITRFYIDAVITFACAIFLATSRLWAPVQLPVAWIVVFCAMLLLVVAILLFLLKIIKRINLYSSTPSEIIAAVVRFRRIYMYTELYATAALIGMCVILSFWLPYVNGIMDFILIVGLCALALTLEIFWYRANMRDISLLNDD